MSDYTMILGSNEIVNCDAALILENEEVFRIREDETGQLLIDCDLRDKQGKRIGKIVRNTPVFVAPGYVNRVRPNGPSEVQMIGGQLLSRIERLGPRKISVDGTFNVEGGGCYVVAAPHGMFIPGNHSIIRGNTIHGFGTAIRLTRHSMSIGG
jgi:hypothetical protein